MTAPTIPEVKAVAIPPLDVHGADVCASKLQELQRQAQEEQQQLHLRLQQMRGQELYQQLQQLPAKGSCEAAWAACPRPVAPAPGTPETYGAGGAVPELWPMPHLQSGYPGFNLQPVQLPPLGAGVPLQPWGGGVPGQQLQMPYAGIAPMPQPIPQGMPQSMGQAMPPPVAACQDQPMMPTLLAPKALAPPKGITQPVPLQTYLEPPMMGGDSLGGSQSEAWPGFQIPYPGSGYGPLPPNGAATEPVTSIKHLAGVSAKQDKEILDTLRSSGLALNLKSLDEPEMDIGQMLNMSMATQGSTQQSAKTPSVGTAAGFSPEPTSVFNAAQVQPPVRVTSRSMMQAEEYLRSYRPQRHAQRLTYPSGVNIDFSELAPVMRVVAIANSQSRSRITGAIDSGMHVRTAMQVFRECDRDGCGFLTWSNGQIRDFVMTVFIQLGLVPPAEMQTYAAHTLFDMNRSMCLSACDCLCLVDALLRAISLVDALQVDQVPCARPRSQSPPRGRVAAASVPGSVSSPVAEELAQAQAETERLRQELEELKAAEAAAEAAGDYRPFGSTEGFLEPTSDTSALLSTAKAHAENRRLERELKNLRALASRQRGEVEWLSELKQQLKTSRQEELEEEHQRLMEMQQQEAAEEALVRQQEMEERRQRHLEVLVQERSERRRRLEQREKELQEQELAQEAEEEKLQKKEKDLQQRELELHKERERSIHQAEALRGRELDVSREIGRLQAASAVGPMPAMPAMPVPGPVISPSAVSHVEPEEEADADAAEAAAMAAAQSLENRKLRRELESLRALAHWQQSEVGAAIACKSAASGDPRVRSAAAAAPATGGHQSSSSKPRGALVMAALAGETLAEGHQADAAESPPPACGSTSAPGAGFCHQPMAGRASLSPPSQEPSGGLRGGLEEYDRTVRELMSRVLGRSDDLDSPHSAAARPVRHVLEPVTMK